VHDGEIEAPMPGKVTNVAVTKGPVKFHSSYKTSGTFSRKLTRTGTYTVVCSIHQPDMRMKLRVTR